MKTVVVPPLNADVGELPEAIADGRERALLEVVDIANVACGGHAGDDASMRATLTMCADLGLQVAAHPSYPDRTNFGRARMTLSHDALLAALRQQLDGLRDAAAAAGVAVTLVKPHGALYHDLSDDPTLALDVGRALLQHTPGALVLRAGSAGASALKAVGVRVLGEGFADRRYLDGDRLVPRSEAGALIDEPTEAARQALALALIGRVDTLCVHGDGPHAVPIANAVRRALLGRSA